MFCQTCDKRSECKKICPELEKELRTVTKAKSRMETIVDPFIIENFAYKSKEKGWRVKPTLESD